MQRVQWIDLGRLLPILGPISLAVRSIVFGVDSHAAFHKMQLQTTKKEKTKAALWFIYNAACVTYYVTTLLSLVIKTSAMIVVSDGASMFLFFSLIALFSYYTFLDIQKRLDPVPAETGASTA
ncbi:MAG TPA: hypothetical protein VLF61_02110 [Rhabdochlamydiaceae bacterium]|nr:hypothetical protein [Rhabdochlamydiaceae bacterium]